MAILKAQELYRFFHIGDAETAALRGVSLAIDPGETVAVMGPSGSGKSTLLQCLTGLDEPDAGEVTVGDTRMSRRPEAERARLRALSFGILLQSGNLFQHFSICENIRFQMMMLQKIDEARLKELLQCLGLAHRAHALPTQLSGGETARAGLAVALAGNPPILVADEPTAEVDAQSEARLYAQFDIRRREGLTTLIATHSRVLAHRADRVIRIKDGRLEHE